MDRLLKLANWFEKQAVDIFPQSWDKIKRKFNVGDLVRLKHSNNYAVFMGYAHTHPDGAYLHSVKRFIAPNGEKAFKADPLTTMNGGYLHFDTKNISIKQLNTLWELVALKGEYKLYDEVGEDQIA